MAKKVKQAHGGAVNQFVKGESGNLKGRPPKMLGSLVRELQATGYERVTAGAVLEAMELLLNVDVPSLVKLANDVKQPALVRVIASAMVSKSKWQVLESILDRAHGKASRSLDLMAPAEVISSTPTRIELPGGVFVEV